jgi:DNA-binding winged helix-turn-helix (wHTH) protein
MHLLPDRNMRYDILPEGHPSVDGSVRSSLIRFGPFAADLTTGEIRKHGVRLRLQQQPFEVLAALLERPGHLVTRDELQKRLWPDGIFVDYDRGLNKAVNRLREVLSDSAEEPRYIETVPQRGYRFIADIEKDRQSPAESVPQPAVEAVVHKPVPPAITRFLLPGILIAGVVAVSIGLLREHPELPSKVASLAVLPLENLSADPAQEYFSDGMTDELIGELAHPPPFR